MKATFQDLLENPDIAIIIIRYLKYEDANSLKKVYPVCSFSVDAIHKKSLLNYKKVKEKFSLYPPRTKGKNPANYAIYHAGGDVYKGSSIKNMPKSDVGFLVVIPVPYHEEYSRGVDRHPITLIRKYIEAICTLDPKCSQDNYNEEAALEFARKRIRIIVGLNIKDNHFHLNDTTARLHQKVLQFAQNINGFLKELSYPAWVIPTLWAIDNDSRQELYVDSSKVNWLNSRADKLRGHLRQVKVPQNSTGMSFPFASMRSFLIESKACQSMLGELSSVNTKVYFLTGDADLISLKPIEKNTSVFNLVHKRIAESPGVFLMRLGGAYGFENEDIAQHIRSNFTNLSELYLAKSVLITQLLRSLDITTRNIVAQIDAALAYYSEVHTYTVSEVFDQTDEHFYYKGSKQSPDTQNSPLTKKLRNTKISEPDITAQVTQAIRQGKNWKANHENKEQVFISDRAAQLLTSSKHDLAVILPDASDARNIILGSKKHIQMTYEKSLSVEELRKMINKQHNTQLTASQLNSRFREAGYNKPKIQFHSVVNSLPEARLPFVIYFLTEKTNSIRIEEAKNKIDKQQTTSADIPDVTTFLAVYQKIIEVSQNPKVLLTKKPVIDSTFMNAFAGTKFTTNKDAILTAFFGLESLLRWAVVMMEKIKSLTEPYKIETKSKTVSKGNILSPDIFGKSQKNKVGSKPFSRSLSSEFDEAASNDGLGKKDEIPEHIKKESLLLAEQQRGIGPRNIVGWTIVDVPDVGNCFYEAIIHQMQTINHPFLSDVPVGGVPHLYLRNILNSSDNGEWSEDCVIDQFVQKVPVILAIVDTRQPHSGYTCYYLDMDSTVTTNLNGALPLPDDKPIIRIAATGNHFLSVTKNPALAQGALRASYRAPTLLNASSSFFFERLARENMIERRHDNPASQRAYDKRFGLLLRV